MRRLGLECPARKQADGNDGTQSGSHHHQWHHREFTACFRMQVGGKPTDAKGNHLHA